MKNDQKGTGRWRRKAIFLVLRDTGDIIEKRGGGCSLCPVQCQCLGQFRPLFVAVPTFDKGIVAADAYLKTKDIQYQRHISWRRGESERCFEVCTSLLLPFPSKT